MIVSTLIMLSFFVVKSLLLFHVFDYSEFTNWFEYLSVVFFMPPFFVVVKEFVKSKNIIKRELSNQIKAFEDFENFVDKSVIITKANKTAKITYVNKKFEDVSGWDYSEVLGRDHIIVNSGTQPPKYWKGMYDTVHKGEIWHDIVTNKRKDGSLYYVDSYIKASFDHKGEVTGYMSLRQDVTDIIEKTEEIEKKNIYLEHASKIIRHDMHSGINTYLPRGIKSLKRRLTEEQIQELKIGAPLQLIEDGLHHAQKVYSGVYEFTNLVKQQSQLSKTKCNIKLALEDYLRLTAYKQSVLLDDNLPTDLEVNEALFCTAVDNLIRNGLKYNDSKTKWVKIYSEDSYICIEDNGRGLTQKEFEDLSKPYVRKEGQQESGSGLGLNICKEILKQHGFDIKVSENENTIGTKLKIKL